MKAKEFFDMNNDELIAKLNALKADLYSLRFKLAVNQLSNPLVIKDTKRDIARVMTVLRLRELGRDVEPIKAASRKSK